MKVIKEFFYNDACLSIDLVDTPVSLTVGYLDGTILFHEGWGEDRIEKAALSGKNVDKFEIEPLDSDGTVQVVLQYRAQEETRRHPIGVTNNKEKVETWVARANKIYEKKYGKPPVAT